MRSYTFEIVPLRRVAVARTITLVGTETFGALHRSLEALIGETFGETYAFVLADGGRYGSDTTSPFDAERTSLDTVAPLPGATLTWGVDPPRSSRCTVRCARVRHHSGHSATSYGLLEHFALSAAHERACWEASAGPAGERSLETLSSDLALALELLQSALSERPSLPPRARRLARSASVRARRAQSLRRSPRAV